MLRNTGIATALSLLLFTPARAQTTVQVMTINGAVREVDVKALPRHDIAASRQGLKRMFSGERDGHRVRQVIRLEVRDAP
jgi:hypothetical protein